MITTICYNGMPGVSAVFKNMEKLGISKHLLIEDLSNEDLHRICDDTIVFGAFQPNYMMLINILRSQNPERKIGFLWTSSPSETELQQVEIPYLNHIIGLHNRGQVDFLWFLKPDFLELYDDLPCVFHAPVPVPELPQRTYRPFPDGRLISLLLPNTLKKNIYAQFLAVLAARKKDANITIVTNTGIQHPLVKNKGWMEPRDYKALIEETYLAMHVSHAESFGYGAYEFLGRGIPTLISPTLAKNFGITDIDWNEHKYYDLRRALVVKDPDSISEMVEKILNLTTSQDNKYYNVLSNSIYKEMTHLREYNNTKLVVEFKNNGIS